jgi:DNA-binding CsgD family transcriptional regulator
MNTTSQTSQSKYLVLKKLRFENYLAKQSAAKTISPHHVTLCRDLLNILYHAPCLITWKNQDAEYLGCNKQVLEVTGINSVEAIVGKVDAELPWGINSPLQLVKQTDDDVLAGYVSFVLGKTNIGAKEINLLIKKVPLLNIKGHIIGTINYAMQFFPPNLDGILQIISHSNINISPETIDLIKTVFLDVTDTLHLSFKEKECLRYLIEGYSAKEIAKILSLSPRTIEFYTAQLKRKFNCRKLSLLTVKALELGY